MLFREVIATCYGNLGNTINILCWLNSAGLNIEAASNDYDEIN
jgi:hypothetical protein